MKKKIILNHSFGNAWKVYVDFITCLSHHEDIPGTDSTMIDACLVQMVQSRSKTSHKLKQQFLPRNQQIIENGLS